MLLKSLFFLAYLFSAAFGREVQVALTFDDFPMGSTSLYKKKVRVQGYIEKLNQLEIQTAFFCIGEQLDSKEGRECLELVTENHFVANHSYSHPNLSKIPLETFQNEVERTEGLLSAKPNFRKWFRFPYLDYGDREKMGGTDHKRLKAFRYLKEKGYQHAYVTINTFDWYIDSKVKKALADKKEIHWENLKEAYMELLTGWIEESHQKWSGSLKKDFVHILLFHQNDLNLIYLEDIVKLIKDKNWVIVSPEEALFHPIRYLAYFPNSKGRLFKKPFTLSLEHVDNIFIQKNVIK